MQTSWGDLEVWDAHVHFFSRNFFQTLGAPSGRTPEDIGSTLNWQVPAESESLGAHWVRELDRHGVARAAVIASQHGDENSVIAAVRENTARLLGYFMLNPVAPDALERTRRALDSNAVHAICLFPAMHCYSVQDPRVQQIIDLAAQADVAIFVHCGVLTVGVRKKLKLPSPFDMRYSNPIDLHAVALRFPETNFIVPHFGAGYLREALMLADLCPNVYLDTSSTNSWTKYAVEPATLRQVFERALAVLGPSRLLFGTDSSFFPRGWHRAIFDEQAACLQSLGVGADEARLIFGGNLQRILRIS